MARRLQDRPIDESRKSGLPSARLERPVTILMVTAREADYYSLGRILGGSTWSIERVETCGEARQFLGRHPAPIVICERQLPDGDWKELLELAASRKHPPGVIVTSPSVEPRLWMDACHLGAYAVVRRPFDRADVIWTVSSSLRDWERRRARFELAAMNC